MYFLFIFCAAMCQLVFFFQRCALRGTRWIQGGPRWGACSTTGSPVLLFFAMGDSSLTK